MYIYDSRKCRKGDDFICLPGGELYCRDVSNVGARSITYMTRQSFSLFSADYFDNPSTKLCVIGVTGTNGKTSVCHFLGQALTALGARPYVQGTLSGSLTTPESFDSQSAMREHLNAGGTHFVMEVSSHGIVQHRVDHIMFHVKCLTNITQDHLDYHGSMSDYRRVKLNFMTDFPGDSIYSDEFKLLAPVENKYLFGQFNIENLQATAAILCRLGYAKEAVYSVLKEVKPAEGRFEQVFSSAPFKVIVDFAHTPAGLESVLKVARQLADDQSGRLLVCFGCGGDRDKQKRAMMATVVNDWADVCMVTSDNPRTEDPNLIIADILKGFAANYDPLIAVDRLAAIEGLLAVAKPNDVVVIAGKGHETYQIIGTESFEFSDRLVVVNSLKKLGYA